uniref:hypothetical protein n=1 Tax=Acinetobacter baumannii TaxID=470 RepID=UPI0020918D3A
PQAWAAATPLSLVQSCLGLGFDTSEGQITFDLPVVPDFLDEITLRGVAVNGGSIDVSLRRTGTEVVANVLSRRGHVRVVTMS